MIVRRRSRDSGRGSGGRSRGSVVVLLGTSGSYLEAVHPGEPGGEVVGALPNRILLAGLGQYEPLDALHTERRVGDPAHRFDRYEVIPSRTFPKRVREKRSSGMWSASKQFHLLDVS